MSSPKAQDLVKLYYRIGEVSRIVGVQPHVLRYWESEFRTIRPQKSNKGQRVYSRRDVEKLLRVKDLLKNQGFTIAGARKQLTQREGARESASPSSGSAIAQPMPAPAPAPALAAGALPPPSPGAAAPTSRSDAKQMRRALVRLRSEIIEMIEELSADGRPEA